MDHVTFGRTGLRVSAACLGAGGHSRLGQRQGLSTAHSVKLVQAALDMGITIVDTAPAYGTEEIVGAALAGRRDGVVVSTKVTIQRDEKSDKAEDLIDAAALARSAEDSLRRLRTDRIDVLHLHGVSPRQYARCRDVLAPEMERLRGQGKIRFIGITERFAFDTRHEMAEMALRDDIWDVAMIGYNLLNPSAAKHALPLARANGTATMCMFAVRGGLASREAARALIEDLIGRGDLAATAFDRADPLGFLAAPGVAATIAEAAYRFCRHTPGIDVVMTGTGNVDHLRENLRAINGPPLPAPVLARLDQLFGAVDSTAGDPVKAAG